MTNQHPITPPPELVEKWVAATQSNDCIGAYPANYEQLICIAAARWGADMELEACVKHLKRIWSPSDTIDSLCTARRPKPPSLKEQALAALNEIEDKMLGPTIQEQLIRRALESLPD